MIENTEQIDQDERRERLVDELRDHLGGCGARVLQRLHVLAQWASEDVVDAAQRRSGDCRGDESAAMTRLRDLLAIIEERTMCYGERPE